MLRTSEEVTGRLGGAGLRGVVRGVCLLAWKAHMCGVKVVAEKGSGFVYKELIPKGGGGAGGGSHKRAAYSILIFPEPNFGSRFFLGGVSEPKDPPPRSYKQSLEGM